MRRRKSIGMIGLGLLGYAIACRLMAAGFVVTGYDLDTKRCRALRRAGGRAVDTAEDVTAASDRVLLSLPTTSVVESVLRRVRPSLRRGSLVIDTTTGDPSRTTNLAAQLARRGVRYVDATVLGSSVEARRGEVVVFAGGALQSVRAARDVLDAFARQVIHVGPCGAGMRMKLVVNLVLGLNRAVLAEGLAFAEAAGVAPRLALEALRTGAAYSRVMDVKGVKMVEGDFRPQARLAQHLKDVGLILSAGRRCSASLPLSKIHRRLLQRLVDAGLGDLDNSAVIRAFHQTTKRARR